MQAQPTTRLNGHNATVFYGFVAGFALLWAVLTDPGLELYTKLPEELGLSMTVGVLLGTAIALFTWLLEPHISALRTLSESLADMIELPNVATCWWVALLSGVVEEALYRGVMQHSFGYVVASVIFGLSHGGLSRRWFAWSTFALIVGLAFGLVVARFGSFWPAALAHVIVNGISLTRLRRMTRRS